MAPSGHLLVKLRSLMQASSCGHVHAYIVPSMDAHQSEYIANCDMRREFISKFSGSAGTAVITHDKAALWTDGRYFLQASKQLDSNWILMKDGLADTPSISDWIKDQLKSGDRVGVDPFLMSSDSWRRMVKDLKVSNISLVAVHENLIDRVWEDKSNLTPEDTIRPPKPCNSLICLDKSITGKEWTEKVEELRKELQKKKAGSIVLTALDDIAWLLNLRGSDIDFNPVFVAYCIVTMKGIFLFIDEKKLTPQVKEFINAVQFSGSSLEVPEKSVAIVAYENVIQFIKTILVPQSQELIWVSNRSSQAVVESVPEEKLLSLASPVTKSKAIKNPIEVNNMKNCHIRDAAALCEYLCWLESTIEANPDGNEFLWEIQGADYLERCRKNQERFMGLSFPSISASGPNGSVIHYHPEEATRRPIGKKELYLIDSGAQYLDGTTDVTRTVHFGTPSPKEQECFTYVLKGHIQLARAIFPKMVKAHCLDSFARQFLWSKGLDYYHGTGHGVGMFLNVHEGPCSISPRSSPDDPGLDVGHVLSNEPGFYENDAFGIRIESLVVTRKVETKYNFDKKDFLEFETITLVPIQLKMIDVKLMTDEEIDWLNEYHRTCREVVGTYLDKLGKTEVKRWLIKETEKLLR